jgi:cytosine/creatinine deaminase
LGPAKAAMAYDILIRNAQLKDSPGTKTSIAIAQGKIAAVAENIDGQAETVIDAEGRLVSESFVNAHLHLCKVYTLQMMDDDSLKDYHGSDMGKAMSAIELAARVKEKYDRSWILPNARKALAQAVLYGCTHLRAFADVDSKARLEGVLALIQAREEFKGVVEVQVVAFAQDGLLREPGAESLMRQALELGADVVGGIPWIEYTEADIREHVRIVFDLAVEFDKDVSMLVDDAGDPGLRSLEMMAVETIRRGWQGRSLAHHARAMALYPMPYFQKISALLKQSHMGLVSDPHTGPLHARVRELLENGNLVSLAQDDISDAYYPFGRNNLLEVAFLGSHLLWFTSKQDIQKLYDLVTVDAARCMGLKDFELRVGASANLVVLSQPDVVEALRFHEAPRYTISHGKLVAGEKYRQIAFG